MAYYQQSSLDVHVTGRRVVATLIDGLVFGVIAGLLNLLFGVDTAGDGFNVTRLSSGGNGILFVVALAYYTLLEGSTGRTVGKMVTGIKVIDEQTGAAPGYPKAFLRTILRLVDGIFAYLVGFIITVNSDRRRRLGDMAAKTLVVRA